MKKKKIIPAIIILLIVIVAGSCFWYFQYKKPHDEAVALKEFKAVSALKESNKPLDEAVSSLKSVIDSKEEPLDPATLTTAKGKLSDAKKN